MTCLKPKHKNDSAAEIPKDGFFTAREMPFRIKTSASCIDFSLSFSNPEALLKDFCAPWKNKFGWRDIAEMDDCALANCRDALLEMND